MKIDAKDADWVSVSEYLKRVVPLEVFQGQSTLDLIETMREVVTRQGREDTFLAFLLISRKYDDIGFDVSENQAVGTTTPWSFLFSQLTRLY